jgi:hypothetical protein
MPNVEDPEAILASWVVTQIQSKVVCRQSYCEE